MESNSNSTKDSRKSLLTNGLIPLGSLRSLDSSNREAVMDKKEKTTGKRPKNKWMQKTKELN